MFLNRIAVALVVLAVAGATTALADLIAAKTPYYDVNKEKHPFLDPTSTDSDLCWVAAASNVLMSTGWAVDYTGDDYIDPTADVYQELRDNFPNTGGWAYQAYRYYFSANHPSENYRDYYDYVWGHESVQAMTQMFQRGFPVVLNFHGTHRSGTFDIYHSMTAWAIDLDATGAGTIYVTDSDDIWNWGVSGTQAYAIYWEQGLYHIEWFIDYGIYHGNIEFPRSEIRSVEVLLPMAEPGILVLLIVGMGLLLGRRAWREE